MSVTLIAFTLLMLPGILFVLLPALPGILYMLIVAFVYAFIGDFSNLEVNELLVLLGLYILSILVDYLSGVVGAKISGAHKKSLLYGFIGIVVGFILFPPLGSIIGLFLGIYLSEFFRHQDEMKALKAAVGSSAGAFTGVLINIFLALTFIILFILFSI